MATDQLTLNVTCPECGSLLPMRTNGRSTGQGTAEITFDTSKIRAHIADHQPKPEPVAPGVQIISDPDAWPSIRDNEQRLSRLLTWLRANGINPNDVPSDSTLTIGAEAGQVVIRHTVYIRDGGRIRADDAGVPVQEERTVPLAVSLDDWPSPVEPVEPDAPLDEDHGTIVLELGNTPQAAPAEPTP